MYVDIHSHTSFSLLACFCSNLRSHKAFMSFKVNCFNRVKKTLLVGLSRKESIKMQIIVVKLCAVYRTWGAMRISVYTYRS